MSALNGQQFLPGFDPPPSVEPVAPQRSDRFIGLRNNRKPVGMRGSIPDRAGLGERQAKSQIMRGRRSSLQERHRVDSMDEYDIDIDDLTDEGEIVKHPRTGLPAVGNISTETIGFRQTMGAVPAWATYHGSAESAWTKHADIKEVPIPTLITPQHEVQSPRLHELIDNPQTRDSRSVRGLPVELPRVYHNEHSEDILVDGNHRMSADLLQGQMFARARVIGPEHKTAITHQNAKIKGAKIGAKRNLQDRGIDPEDIQNRWNDAMYGTDNW